MTALIEMIGGTYWHTTLTVDQVLAASQVGPWINLPLVHGDSEHNPTIAIVARDHISSISDAT